MSTNALTPPEPLDLVAFDHVRAIIEDTDRDLTELERLAIAATAEADEAEARAADAGVDAPASHWTLVQMQRFVNSLRAEADLERNAIVEVARYRARVRVDDARADVERMRSEPVAPVAGPAVAQGGDGDVEVPCPTPMPEEREPLSNSVVDDVARDQAGFESFAPKGGVAAEQNGTAARATESVTPAAWSFTSASRAPSTPETEPPIAETQSATVTRAETLNEPALVPYTGDEQPVEAPVAVPLMSDPLASDATGDGTQDFWPTETTVPRRRGLRRIPFSAVLEVLVVLLILVFILLRLS
jgi:hypothetical protein